MKASELIEKIQKAIEEVGDTNVRLSVEEYHVTANDVYIDRKDQICISE